MFPHAHDTDELSHSKSMLVQKMAKFQSDFTRLSVCLSLDDSGVSQQMTFISGSSLPQLSDHIFEIVQDHNIPTQI